MKIFAAILQVCHGDTLVKGCVETMLRDLRDSWRPMLSVLYTFLFYLLYVVSTVCSIINGVHIWIHRM